MIHRRARGEDGIARNARLSFLDEEAGSYEVSSGFPLLVLFPVYLPDSREVSLIAETLRAR